MTTATALAHPNLALIKYWGKRDDDLMLPAAGSLSLTLDVFPTTTSVTLIDDRADTDRFVMNGTMSSGEPLRRVSTFLDLVRAAAGSTRRALVASENAGPTAAGLASSAAGFAALAVAASAAYGLTLSSPALSRLARRGSGSAARSIIGGMALMHAGDDEGSYAEPVPAPSLAMVIAVVDSGAKRVSSRAAMRSTASTSPFYRAWVDSQASALDEMVDACARGDVQRIGELTEMNALRMHAVIQASEPPIRYLQPRSVEIFDRVAGLREAGVPAYATADAGPNVAVLCPPESVARVVSALTDIATLQVAGPGPGAHLIAADERASVLDEVRG